MPGSVTSLPALMAALKQCAPWVSMAIMGTCCQPTSARPADTPARRPPPPTATTRAPGGVPSAAFSSRTRLTWPSLWDEGVGEVAGLRAGPVHKAHRDTAPHSASPRPVHSRGRGDPATLSSLSFHPLSSFFHSFFLPFVSLPGTFSIHFIHPITLERNTVNIVVGKMPSKHRYVKRKRQNNERYALLE